MMDVLHAPKGTRSANFNSDQPFPPRRLYYNKLVFRFAVMHQEVYANGFLVHNGTCVAAMGDIVCFPVVE